MKDNVLLIGNGVNNAEGGDYRWKDLVNDLIKNFSVGKKIRTDSKPFPLLYEEIFLNAISSGKFKESDLKKFIAAKTFDMIQTNQIHDDLVKLPVSNILTTNYDYNLEFNIKSDFKKYNNAGFKKEALYSLYRHHTLNNINFWHIHGEARYHQTINLGYEQYGGYLQFIRNYLINGVSDVKGKKILQPFINRIKYPIKENHSWVDFFFTKNIYIIGLTLDMDEMHLWWLLSFRQRFKLTKFKGINNTISYFYPKKFTNQAKLDLLQSLGVTTICINADEKKFYNEVIKRLS
ncbi:MAG: SIR2 family protein [Bacteroidia bacterium]